MEQLNLTQEWDKVFPKSEMVGHGKVTCLLYTSPSPRDRG